MNLTDHELLERAVRGVRDPTAPDGVDHPRWVAVNRTFGLGMSSSAKLCRRFGLDPEEPVQRYTRD